MKTLPPFRVAFPAAVLIACLSLGAGAAQADDSAPSATGATDQQETALTARLHPAPLSFTNQVQERLGRTLASLLEDRKALDRRLTGYFARWGPDVDIHSPQYPQYLNDRSSITAANDALLGRMRAYNASVLDSLENYIRQVTVEMDGLKKNLTGQQRSYEEETGAFEDLADLSQKERDKFLDELRDCAKDAAMEAGEAGAEKALDAAAKITPDKARKIIARLEKAGADNPDLLDLIRAISDAKNKEARLKEGKRFYKMLKNEATIWKLDSVLVREEYLAALIEVISWVSPSPWLKVCAEGVFDSAKADLTAWCVLGREEKALTSAAETQLRQLKGVAEKLVALTKERKKARQELQEMPGRYIDSATSDGGGDQSRRR